MKDLVLKLVLKTEIDEICCMHSYYEHYITFWVLYFRVFIINGTYILPLKKKQIT